MLRWRGGEVARSCAAADADDDSVDKLCRCCACSCFAGAAWRWLRADAALLLAGGFSPTPLRQLQGLQVREAAARRRYKESEECLELAARSHLCCSGMDAATADKGTDRIAL